jgi:RNA polymerase sigma factor (sigma-70 family)
MMSVVRPIRAPIDREPTTWPDEAVASACSHAVGEAVGELFERFEVPVTRFLSRLIGGIDAEELVIATFLQIASGKAGFDGNTSAKAWLFAIATNVFRRHAHSSSRDKPRCIAQGRINCGDTTDDRSSEDRGSASVQCVSAAFESLSEMPRLAFLLCDVEGFNTREASQILKSSEASIRQCVAKARMILVRAAKGAQT